MSVDLECVVCDNLGVTMIITKLKLTHTHSHEYGSLFDKEFNGSEIRKHHIDDKEEEGPTPVE
jgi:hypothetical protein